MPGGEDLSPTPPLPEDVHADASAPEDTLRDSAIVGAFFEELFEEASEGIVFVDAHRRVIRSNRQFREMFQYSDEEIRGKIIDHLVTTSSEELAEAEDLSRRVGAGEYVSLSSTFRSRKDGSRLPVALTVFPIKTSRGAFHYAAYQDISSLCLAEDSLRRRLVLEKVLSRISARFLKDLCLDHAIHQALGDLGAFFSADRGYVFQVDPEGATHSNTHEWCAPGISPAKDQLQRIAMDATPWWIDTLRREGAIIVPDVRSMPPEAAHEREILRAQGIQSLFVLSWGSGDSVTGYVGFDNNRHPGAWSQDDVEELKFFRDLLEHALKKRATERALRQSEKRYEAVVQDQDDLVCRFSPDGLLRFANRAFFSFFGLDRHALHAFSVFQCALPSAQEPLREAMARIVLKSPRLLRTERMITRGGETRWLQWSYGGIFDDRGSLLEIQGVGRDITEAIKTEQALRESRDLLEQRVEQRTAELETTNRELRQENARRKKTEDALKAQIRYTEAILRTVPDAVLVFDQGGTVTDVVTHMAPDQLPRFPSGHKLEDFLPPETVPRVREAIGRTLSHLSLQTVEYTDEGGRSFEARLAPLCRGDHLCDRVVCLAIDITHRKEIEESIRAARDQAEGANRAKSVFLANMSHEIRTPLNAVLGMARLLKDSLLSEDQQDLLQHILSSGEKLLSLLNNLLTLARLETEGISPTPGPLDLRALVEKAGSETGQLFRRKGLTFRVLWDPRLPEKVLGDEGLLRTCLDVLLHNAASFTSEGGVSLAISPEDPGGNPSLYRFSVTDSGIGIAAQDLKKIFEPFTQLDDGLSKRHQGAGTGLAITKRIVQALGGSVSVESVPGKGSTFSFSLNLPPASGPGPSGGFPLPPGLRVLLVEDNPVDRKLIQLMLRKDKAELRVAESGDQATEMLEREPFDLVILDMPEGELGCLKDALSLRDQRYPSLSLVALGASARPEDSGRWFDAGGDGFIPKPFTAETLHQALRQALDRRAPRRSPEKKAKKTPREARKG